MKNNFIQLHQELNRQLNEKLAPKDIGEGKKRFDGKVQPVTPEDKELSKKHLEQSIAFNMAHIKDHQEHAEKAQRLLNSEAYFSKS